MHTPSPNVSSGRSGQLTSPRPASSTNGSYWPVSASPRLKHCSAASGSSRAGSTPGAGDDPSGALTDASIDALAAPAELLPAAPPVESGAAELGEPVDATSPTVELPPAPACVVPACGSAVVPGGVGLAVHPQAVSASCTAGHDPAPSVRLGARRSPVFVSLEPIRRASVYSAGPGTLAIGPTSSPARSTRGHRGFPPCSPHLRRCQGLARWSRRLLPTLLLLRCRSRAHPMLPPRWCQWRLLARFRLEGPTLGRRRRTSPRALPRPNQRS